MATIKLKIYVANLSNVLTLFDTIRVYRSTTGEAGVYELTTGDVAAAATLLGSQIAPFTLNGLTLVVSVDGGSDQTVTFASPNPVGVDAAIDEINDQTTGLIATEESGAIRLTSDTTGTSSTLEITGGTGLTALGFTLGDLDIGEDQHIALQAGVENYEYDDQSGDISYWYKTQYYNTGSGGFSSLSDPIQGDVGTTLPSSELVTGTVDVVDPDGKPVEDMRIVFYNIYTPPLERGAYVAIGRTVTVTTDQAGHAEVSLIKGMIVDVTFAGTGVTRRIQIPDADFTLWDEIAVADDNYQIQVPTIVDAVRRS